MGLRFLKPIPSLGGYLKLALFPVLLGQILMYYGRRKRNLFVVGALGYFIFSLWGGLASLLLVNAILATTIFAIIPVAQQIIYNVAFVISKAIEDTKKVK